MIRYLIIVLCLSVHISNQPLQASSMGKRMTGVVGLVSGQPAICLPTGLEKPFLLGWLNLSQVAMEKSPGWGIELKPEEKPLLLNGGDCMVFGDIPENYRPSILRGENVLTNIEAGHEYFFSMVSFERSVDSYDAFFYVERTSNGVLKYYQSDHVRELDEIKTEK